MDHVPSFCNIMVRKILDRIRTYFQHVFCLQSDHQGIDGPVEPGQESALQHPAAADLGPWCPASHDPLFNDHSWLRITSYCRSIDCYSGKQCIFLLQDKIKNNMNIKMSIDKLKSKFYMTFQNFLNESLKSLDKSYTNNGHLNLHSSSGLDAKPLHIDAKTLNQLHQQENNNKK